jgi:exonuclease III
VVVGDINTPLSPTDISPDKKSIKKLELNDTTDQMDLTDIYRVFQPATAQYTFFSAAHETSSKIDHILGQKQVLANIRKLK